MIQAFVFFRSRPLRSRPLAPRVCPVTQCPSIGLPRIYRYDPDVQAKPFLQERAVGRRSRVDGCGRRGGVGRIRELFFQMPSIFSRRNGPGRRTHPDECLGALGKNNDCSRSSRQLQEYTIDLKACGPMILDALIKIKDEAHGPRPGCAPGGPCGAVQPAD